MQNCYPRFNAGRPTLPSAQRTVNVTAAILPSQREWALAFGEGNLSGGIRKAIAIAMQVVSPERAAAELARRQAYVADAPRRQAEDDALQDAALADFAATDGLATATAAADRLDLTDPALTGEFD